MRQINEKNAKVQLLQYLLKRESFSKNVAIINELALASFSRRADLALINGSIEIFEIKSEADTLDRLSGQVQTFSKYCDKLHIVGAPRHIEKILSCTPDHVAVWQLESKCVKIIRRGKKNILRDRISLIKLLNGFELRQMLIENCLCYASLRRKHLEEAAQQLSIEKVRSHVLLVLKRRYAQSTERFLRTVAEYKEMVPAHLVELKRQKLQPQSFLRRPKLAEAINDDRYLLELSNLNSEKLFGRPPDEVSMLLNS